jgi:N-acetylglucosaminyldiphosphoundecaprenol N-acetyl-beta-D-mannosaminyltransferase
MSGDEYLAKINDSRADFLVVALGARKGQAWIERNRAQLQVPVVGHLGAVINHAAGTVHRAPKWMQKAGLEWLWRIREEPALWRRYLRDGMVFGWLVASCVLPQFWRGLRYQPSAEALAAATVGTDTAKDLAIIVLRGAWGQSNLDRLRACLNESFLTDRDVYVEMETVSHVDSAFIGLLLLLYGHQKQQGRRLRLGPMRARVRRTFEYSCAEFLFGESEAMAD